MQSGLIRSGQHLERHGRSGPLGDNHDNRHGARCQIGGYSGFDFRSGHREAGLLAADEHLSGIGQVRSLEGYFRSRASCLRSEALHIGWPAFPAGKVVRGRGLGAAND